jgi:hypothetical protein
MEMASPPSPTSVVADGDVALLDIGKLAVTRYRGRAKHSDTMGNAHRLNPLT